jgi:hypothetical protein
MTTVIRVAIHCPRAGCGGRMMLDFEGRMYRHQQPLLKCTLCGRSEEIPEKRQPILPNNLRNRIERRPYIS